VSDLDVMLELADRIGVARAAWCEVARLAVDVGDDELGGEVYIARAGILGAADRLEQLIENPLPEMEVA
jgi:hypothetical protein